MRARKVLGRIGIGVGIALASVVFLVGAALLLLHTPFGAERARRLIVPRVNDAIAGRLDVSKLRLHGDGVELSGVRLHDPEGALVAEVARVDLSLALRALVRRRIVVEELVLERPRLTLVQTARGLNLARAVAARKPTPPEPPGEPGALDLNVQRFAIRDGALSFRDASNPEALAVKLEQIETDARAAVRTGDGPARYSGRLAIGARTRLPMDAPFSLRAQAEGAGADAGGGLRLNWGAALAELAARSRDERHQELTIERLAVPPRLTRVLAPGLPLVAFVEGKGRVRRAGDRVDVALDVGAKQTSVRLTADVDLARQYARSLRLVAREVDLGRLFAGAPASRFDVRLEGEGGGRDLARAAGRVSLEVPRGEIGGRPLGPVTVAASAAGGRYTLDALDVALPGVTLTARGAGDRGAVRGQANLVASDLALTARSLRLPRSLGLAGHGKLALRVTGPAAGPGATLDVVVPSLRVSGSELAGIKLGAKVADLRRAPAGSDLKLTVTRARSGRQLVRDLSVALAGDAGEGVRLTVAAAAPVPLSLTAAGQVGPRATRIELTRLDLDYPQVAWRLAQPARIRRGDALLSVKGLDLRAAPEQRIALDLEQRGTRIDADVAVARFDLARVPAALLPRGTTLAGLVDVTLAAAGPAARPDATARIKLDGGKLGKLERLGLLLDARHRRGRVSGTLAAEALAASHSARFDLPAAWPPPAHAPIELAAKIGEIDLAAVDQGPRNPLASKEPRLHGRGGLELAIEGRAGDPTLKLRAHARELALARNQPRIDEVTVTLDDPAGGPLAVAAVAKVLGRQSSIALETPAVLGAWLRRPPSAEALLALPFSLRAKVDALPLAAFASGPPAGGGRPSYSGTLSGEARFAGPLVRLTGGLGARADEVRGPGFPPTNAQLAARLGEGRAGLDVRLGVSRRGRQLARVDAELGMSVADFIARRNLASAPLRVAGQVGPIALQRIGAREAGRPRPRRLRAAVEARFDVAGTLAAPRANLALGVADARFGGQPLGSLGVRARYADARPHFELGLASAAGGDLRVVADARVDLSLPALDRGIVAREIPIESTVVSRGLDLGFLSALHEDVRAVAGKLDADARVGGTVGAPQLAGKVGLKGGRLVHALYGELRDLELALRGDAREMVVDKLFARSGNGSANVVAKAVRTPDGRQMKVEANADVHRFRILTDGQPLGALSLRAEARGTIAPDRADFDARISEGHMELDGSDRRRLQPLRRRSDIVLLVEGEPLDRTQARRLAALQAEARQAPTAGEVADAAVAVAAPDPPPPPPRPVRIAIAAPRNLWVRGPDANLEIGLQPGFVVNMTDELRIFGTVAVRRGFVEVLGRRFDLGAESTVRFTGPPERPELAVDATYHAEAAETTVAVKIEGPADAISFTLRSPEHPEYGDTELLSLIATGHLPEDSGAGTSAATKAASILGGVLADRLQKVLTSRLPIDVLTIEPGEDLSGTRLEAGAYLNEDIYVAYVGRLEQDPLGRENRNEVHLEYQLSSRWSFEASYGDARRGSVDLVWTRHF